MDHLLGDAAVLSPGRDMKHLELNFNSPEYLQAKQERIEKRRARIAAKIAREKGEDTASSVTPSSLDFLTAHNATSEIGRRDAQKKRGDRKGSSAGSRRESEPAALLPKQFTDPQMEAQLEDSRKQLEQIILDGEALITNVKIAAEYREKVRHVRLEESRAERLQRLHEEARESQEMYDNIAGNWMANAQKMLPLEFYAQIQKQQKACDELLEKQDEEIYNLKKELEDQDIEYENNLEMYQKDVMLLGDRIDDTVDTLRTAFMEELELIEQYTVQDREQLLEENQKEFMNLLQQYEEFEKKSLEERKSDALGKFDRLTDLYGSVKQEARLLKNQIQHDMRTLFMEREQIKCAIQLNLEKLDYNLSVLRKREEENMRMKNSMKRLLLKLQDRFNEKAATLREKVAKGKRDSNRYINEIRRLESLCDDAKRKTLHIYASDYHKFMDLWELNEEECMEKLCRLLGSERYIIEEQLGARFAQPDLTRLEERPKEIQCYLNRANNCSAGLNRNVGNLKTPKSRTPADTSIVKFPPSVLGGKVEGVQSSTDSKGPSMTSVMGVSMASMERGGKSTLSLVVDPASEYEFADVTTPDPELLRNLMKHIAKVICDQTGFLLEDKLRTLIAELVDSDRQLIHIDTVLQALNVTHIDQMQFLARHILKYSRVMKGIVSKINLSVPDMNEMQLSEDGVHHDAPSSNSECEVDEMDAGEGALDYLREVRRLSATSSSDDPDNKRITTAIPPSASTLLSETALENIKEVTEVRGLPPSASGSNYTLGIPTALDSEPAQVKNEEDKESDPSVVEIIQEFSSDESLAVVLRQVEMYNSRPEDDIGDSSTCSCETLVDISEPTSNKDSVDPFGSNKATVLSWVTEVAAGLTSGCQEVSGDYDEDQVEEVDDKGVRSASSRRRETRLSRSDDRSEMPSQEFPSRTTPTAKSSCGNSVRSRIVTVDTPQSGPDSTEFFYVEPNDVLRALAAFCRDHHSKTKARIPTKAEICDAKIAKLALPSKEAVKDYWDRFIRLTDPKSKFLWDGIQSVFLEYDENLKLRNQYVEDIVRLYRQNYELSHLLKKHIKEAHEACYGRNTVGPFHPSQVPFCGDNGRRGVARYMKESAQGSHNYRPPCPSSSGASKEQRDNHNLLEVNE